MSGAISIIGLPPGLVPASGAAFSLPDQASGSAAGSPSGNAGQAGAATALGPSNLPHSPSIYLDPSLNLVVLAFFNANGEVTSTIPSAQQLQAYKLQGSVQPPGSTVSHIS